MTCTALAVGFGTARGQTPPPASTPAPNPAPTPAGTPPVITSGPTISLPRGVTAPRVDDVLQASASFTGRPRPDAEWTWRRCTGQQGGCDNIKGAKAVRYTVTTADVGYVLRVRLTLTSTAGSTQAHSAFTPAVVAPPSPSTTPPTPAPTPAPSAPPFVLTPTPPAAGAQPASPHLLRPFPTVRIKGWVTTRGARITLLSVRAPRSARIAVSCRGSSCPQRRLKRKGGGVKRLRPFERELRAGTRLSFRVTRRGTIGKWTTILIRRGAAPRRTDGCLDSDTGKRVTCPA